MRVLHTSTFMQFSRNYGPRVLIPKRKKILVAEAPKMLERREEKRAVYLSVATAKVITDAE